MTTTSGPLLTLDDVYEARKRIAGRLHRTPMLSSRTLSERVGATVHFKAELLQRTGSFKPRGVLNKLATLSDDEKARGVISISAGNHAQALAYAAAVEGIDALVVMWQTASPMKIAAARGYGATVDDSPPDMPAAFEHRVQRLEVHEGHHAAQDRLGGAREDVHQEVGRDREVLGEAEGEVDRGRVRMHDRDAGKQIQARSGEEEKLENGDRVEPR